MRHAHTNAPDAGTKDHERKLTAVGKAQPYILAQKLKELQISIDQALVSPAYRTAETFMLLKESMLFEIKAEFYPELYNATLENMLEILPNHISERGSVLVLGHCPSVNQLTEYLTGHNHFFAPGDLAILVAKGQDLVQSLLAPQGFSFWQILKSS